MKNGYEVYQLLTSLRIHFSQPSYNYSRKSLIVPKLETYYSDKNYTFYEGMVRYDWEYLEHLYLSNCLHTNGFVQPLQLKNSLAHKIKSKWEETIEISDQIFTTELLMLMDKDNIDNPFDLFELIKNGTSNKSKSEFKNVESILDVIDDKIESSEIGNNEVINELCDKDIHFVIILDEIMKRYYNYSFLQMFSDDAHSPLFFALKYKECLPMSDIMQKEKIKMFCECLS